MKYLTKASLYLFSIALLAVGAIGINPTSVYAAAPTGASAVIQNATATEVDIVITGSDEDEKSSDDLR